MGVFHFMGVGRAVGAVTCAVDYIEKALDRVEDQTATPEIIQLFSSSGGITHKEENIGKIEAIVLFTSEEVIKRQLSAFHYQGCEKPSNVRTEIVQNLRNVWKRGPKVGKKVFWCEVNIDNYQDCFDKMIQVAYRFSQPGKQGKEIWCNLTGGSNAIQLALLSMTRLTAVSTKHYLISQRKEYQKEIKVPAHIKVNPNKDEYFNTLPFLKFAIDTSSFYNILTELDSSGQMTTAELWGRLKAKKHFCDCSLDEFKRQYMLKLYGLGYTEYNDQNDQSAISDLGLEFLVNELFELEKKLSEKHIDIVSESKTWPWFQQVDKI
ncbi:MAG: hypothetical protein VSS75_009515 [Candidatus Parabeggiatoa sp.]|nr:hypothetical protein [Candidatus Parabeggiatoa sp.]